MGTIIHTTTIFVVNTEGADALYKLALRHFEKGSFEHLVSPPVPQMINSSSVMTIVSTGSKEGWSCAEDFRRYRDEFIDNLRSRKPYGWLPKSHMIIEEIIQIEHGEAPVECVER